MWVNQGRIISPCSAYTTPQTRTDHVVGLRFVYDPPPLMTAALADEAVTAEKIAPNTIDASRLTFAAATQGDVAAGITTAVAAAKITSIEGLNGLACSANGIPGATVVEVGTERQVSIRCDVPTPCCEIDEITVQQFRTFLRMSGGAIIMAARCVGTLSGAGSGYCVSGASILPRMDAAFINHASSAPTFSMYATSKHFEIPPIQPLQVLYNVAGVVGSCQATIVGDGPGGGFYLIGVTQSAKSDLVMSPDGPVRRLEGQPPIQTFIASLSVNGCSNLPAELNFGQVTASAFVEALRSSVHVTPLCWKGTEPDLMFPPFVSCPLP